MVMMMDYRLYLMSVSLHKNDNVETWIRREGKVISLDDSDQIDISKVFHCDGLLLCVAEDNTRLVVWNPYWGTTRWIETTHNFHRLDRYIYALGHDKSTNSHKILRLVDFPEPAFFELKIYDFYSSTWRVLDLTPPDLEIMYYCRGVSLKGDSYWVATERVLEGREYDKSFLLCFDFTRESFGPHLPLPFEPCCGETTLTLSSVREEQLAVLFQHCDTSKMEIWVTSKIEPNTVSWNTKVFLAVDMRPLGLTCASFFIDEEKKVAVVFDKGFVFHKELQVLNQVKRNNVAYIVGVDGTLKQADLGESAFRQCYPLACSYTPSLVEL